MTRIFRAVLAMAMVLVCAQAVLARGPYRVEPRTSQIGFTIRNFFSPTPGVFKTFQGELDFSESQPETSSVQFAIEVASVDTGITKRDEHLRTADYFDAPTYPQMTFSSRSFQRVGPDRYRITGLLTIREHSKEISVLARLTRHASLWAVPENSLLFETAFEVDRLEFGVGKPSHLLGNRVAVNLKLDFRAQMSK